MALAGNSRYDDQRDARTIAEEVERLDAARGEVAAAFVGDRN